MAGYHFDWLLRQSPQFCTEVLGVRGGKWDFSIFLAVPIVVALPALTALHALYFDRHWATDIIGGWLAGAAIASGCAYGYEIAQARKKAPRIRPKPR